MPEHINDGYDDPVEADRCELLCLDLPRAEALRRRADRGLAAQIAKTARVLGSPTRVLILETIADAEELCVCDLAWITEHSQNLVSHHLRALRDAGFVSSRREGKIVFYSLSEQGAGLRAVFAEAGYLRGRSHEHA